jgi:hypothetical protein
MGNFKHQPLRSSDREARERERDLRDKDAQDKLRSVRYVCNSPNKPSLSFFTAFRQIRP